jgi:2-keto-4-pentenoate hydratase/2-oxohepta-3-ene-1,7-dioic acid hydratase in catechol pathway
MRLATIEIEGLAQWGVVEGNAIALIDRWPTLQKVIEAGKLKEAASSASGVRVAIDEVRWLPVIPEPTKIICVGLNYEKHRRETGRGVMSNPTLFTRFADSQTGHLREIVLPPESDQLDFEGELAVVIGTGGRRIPEERALDHVAGYACYNDGSIRDWQAHTIQFTPGKNWPETGSFGPWLVTPDEIGPLGPQRIQTRLNGTVMQDATLSEMIFSVPRLIAYISTFTVLSPGDVIVSGTPGGVGAKRDPQVFMKEGDRVEVEIDGVGLLVNNIGRRD